METTYQVQVILEQAHGKFTPMEATYQVHVSLNKARAWYYYSVLPTLWFLHISLVSLSLSLSLSFSPSHFFCVSVSVSFFSLSLSLSLSLSFSLFFSCIACTFPLCMCGVLF